MRLMGTNEWRKIWGKLEAAARCTALALRPEARLRRIGALLEGVMTWVRRWAERGANMEHDRGESCTCSKAEVVSTEATGRRNSMREGEHEAKHEEGGEEVCEDGGGSGNITIGVGEDGTRRYAEGESRTGESEDVGCRVNSSTGTGVGTSVETLGRKSGVHCYDTSLSIQTRPLLPLRFRSTRVHATQASVCWRALSTVDSLFFIDVPTNPGPRSFRAWAVRRCH